MILQEVAFGKVKLGLELSNRGVGGSALDRSSVIKVEWEFVSHWDHVWRTRVVGIFSLAYIGVVKPEFC